MVVELGLGFGHIGIHWLSVTPHVPPDWKTRTPLGLDWTAAQAIRNNVTSLHKTLHYGTEDLNAGKHAFELPRRDFFTLDVDLKQQGVGGDDSWGVWPHEEFLIPCQEYSYSFRLGPFSSTDSAAKLARETLPEN